MKMKIDISFIGGYLLTTNCDFTFVRSVSSRCDINLKLKMGLDGFTHRSDWYPHSVTNIHFGLEGINS